MNPIQSFYNSTEFDPIRGHAPQDPKEIARKYERLLRPRDSAFCVLDWACGNALIMLKQLKDPLIDYTGIDFSYKQIEYATRKHPSYRFIFADFLYFPFKPESADLILLRNGLQQIAEPDRPLIFQKAHQVLKAGGSLMISQTSVVIAKEPFLPPHPTLESCLVLADEKLWSIQDSFSQEKTNQWFVQISRK